MTHATGVPIGDALARQLERIAIDVSRRHNWIGYAFIDDMRQDALAACCAYARGFDPARGSARTFIELIVTSAFRKTVKREKRQYAARLRAAVSNGAKLTEHQLDWLTRYAKPPK